MNLPNLRTRTLYVSSATYGALVVQARALNLDCADTLAEAWLAERIAAEPLLVERQKRFAKHMKALDDEMAELAGEEKGDANADKITNPNASA
jgi:hypothetical protein